MTGTARRPPGRYFVRNIAYAARCTRRNKSLMRARSGAGFAWRGIIEVRGRGGRAGHRVGMRQKKRILIVDDEPDLLDSVTKLLTKDYDVVGAVDGVEALARIRTEHFDAVIVDLVMPLMDGA